MSESFYDVLGVPPDASTDEITDAYRERIKETHPDVSDAPDAQDQAKRVIEAKETLTDEDERARYDRLGHDIYVRDTAVDADWSATTDSTSGGASGRGTRKGSRGTREEPGPGAGAESVSEGTWATNGVDDDTASGATEESAASGPTADGAEDTADHAESGSPDQSAASRSESQAAEAEGPNDKSGSRRRQRSRGANSTRNVGDAVGWAAGVDGRHAVRSQTRQRGITWDGLYPDSESYVLLVSTFICYPSLVFSSVFPGFPLVVNLIVGLCTLVLIAYLMSMPEVGVYVFGGWSLLATFLLVGYGVSVFSLLGVLIWGTTFIPLGFTLLTYLILRW